MTTICLSAIMREDDPRTVARCLESVKPLIHAWRIADSGCSDAVRETIRRVLQGIPGELIPIEWQGFANARNIALDAARATGAGYALFVDADDYLEPSGALPHLTADYYAFENDLDNKRFFRLSLTRLDTGARWRGRVHEELMPAGVVAERLPGYLVRCTRDGAGSRDAAAKALRYRNLLVDEITETPTNATSWFRLGDAHVTCRDYASAFESFQRALALGDRDLRYAALVRCANLLSVSDLPPEHTISAFEEALRERPDRAEAPRWLARFLAERGEQPERVRALHRIADTLPVPASVGWVNLGSYGRQA